MTLKYSRIRVGFDDYRARETVYFDLVEAGYTTHLIGAWKPEEAAPIVKRARLMDAIARIASDLAAGLLTLEQSVSAARAQVEDNEPLPLGTD